MNRDTKHRIHARGPSRSFPEGDPIGDALRAGSAGDDAAAEIVLMLGDDGGPLPPITPTPRVVLVELGHECLGVHTGEQAGREGSHVLGFARYRNGDDPPSSLVELVRQPASDDASIETARGFLEAAGLEVVVCADQAGRIVDRLVRPKYNAALRFLDEGLATAEAMDLTCRLGLGYPDGPIERVERGGLTAHHDVTRALFEVYGTPAYAPARRAVVAAQRRARSGAS